MRVSYKKLWLMLVERNMSKADLRKTANISPAILTKLNKGECVHMNSLISICDTLNCDFGDIMEIVKERF